MPRKHWRKMWVQTQPTGIGRAAPGSGAEDDGSHPLKEGTSLLQGELERICWELEQLHRRSAHLRMQHKLLEWETKELRTESQEFLGYMSLGDESWQLQAQIQCEHWELLARSAEQETALRQPETDSTPPSAPLVGAFLITPYLWLCWWVSTSRGNITCMSSSK